MAYKKEVSCDLSEDKENYYCDVNATVFKKDNIDIQLERGQLVISGRHEESKANEGKTYHFKERSSSSFRRFVNLPHSINIDSISTKYANGVLHIIFPKATEAKGKRITIGD